MRGDGDNQPPCGVAEPVSECREKSHTLSSTLSQLGKPFTASERVTMIVDRAQQKIKVRCCC